MATPEPVVTLPRPLPSSIPIEVDGALTPNEMRGLKEHTGRPLNELLGGDPNDLDSAPDRLQSLVWISLRRAGWPDVTWEQAGDVMPEYQRTAERDPTNGEP